MATAVQPSAPSTPSVSAPPAVQRTLTETINKVSQQTSIPATPVVDTPSVKFVKEAPVEATPTDKVPPITETPTTDSASVAPTGPDAAIPPIEAAPLEPTSELSLDDGTVILRAERNADGTYKTKFDPSAKLDFEIVLDKKSGEKKQFSKTLPEIVRLAKDGVVLNQRVQEWKPEVEYYRDNIPKWQQSATETTSRLQSAQQELADQIALNRELLSAPEEVVVGHRERYAQEMSPQKQAERELQALRQQREDMARQMQSSQAQSFIQSRLAPALSEANAVLGEDTVAGMITRTFSGPIPPHEWSKVEQFVNGPLKERVAQERTRQDKAIADAAAHEAALRQTQANAQRAVNDAGRATVPIGSASPDRAAPLPKPKNTKDAIDRMIHRPLPPTISG